MKLEKNKTYHIEFKMQENKSIVYSLNRHIISKYIILDIIFGFVPVIVDAVTGAWYTFDEKDILVGISDDQLYKEILNWKVELLKASRKEWFKNVYGWSRYKKENEISLNDKDWILSLSEDDYDNFISSGKTSEEWLRDIINPRYKIPNGGIHIF
jgi:hypothetical protein